MSEKIIDGISDSKYLKQFEIVENKKYIIGIFQEGITVYKQQIRALNIFSSLYRTGIIKNDPDFAVIIIGGGVAGLTFAAAAIKAGIKIKLIEEKQHYLHMQRGCNIRNLHPNIYDWPDKGSFSPLAKLPVLSWQHDTASNVAKQILNKFNRIKEELKATNSLHDEFLEERRSAQIESVRELVHNGKEEYQVTGDDTNNLFNFYGQVIIYAIGYGVETSVVPDSEVLSYWRNDTTDQSVLNRKNSKFFISGTGDGGLTDLLRLLIQDYSHDLAYKILKSKKEEYENLEKILCGIKSRILDRTGTTTTTLSYEFDTQMPRKHYQYIMDYLMENDLLINKKEKEVALVGLLNQMHDVLDLSKVSFMNAFFCHILLMTKKYKYICGKTKWDANTKTYCIGNDSSIIEGNAKVIERHGTNTGSLFETAKFSDIELARLKELNGLQKEFSTNGQINKRWTYSEMKSFFNPKFSDNQVSDFYTTDTRSICSNLTSVLNRMIEKFFNSTSESPKPRMHYRAALYRVMESEGEMKFQQITSYFGNHSKTINHGIGEVFDIKRGNVGLAFSTGQPNLILRNEEEHFKKLAEKLNLSEDYEKIKSYNSFFALPFMGNYKQKTCTNLVLFLESEEKDFFGSFSEKGEFIHNGIIETIVPVAQGFVDTIKHLIDSKNIYMAYMGFDPIPVDSGVELPLDNPCYIDIATKIPMLSHSESLLTFDEFYTFDIIYENRN